MEKEKKKKNKSDYGEDFIPPDGGFAWVICVTSALSNFSVLPVYQQFGLLYRTKLFGIGMTHSAITSVINLNSAISSLSGFVNGPMFRRFSYRQVALLGSVMTTFAIFLTSISNSYESFLFSFGILFALGIGITFSANSLVFNVFFKEKRSKASSWAWTITGIGPVIFPYLITFFVAYYGVQGAIWLVAGISAHSIAYSLTYQPVLWHVKKNPDRELLPLKSVDQIDKINQGERICTVCNGTINEEDEISTSFEENDKEEEGKSEFEMIAQDPETPMMHTKDTFYKSSDNLAMKYTRQLSLYSLSKNLERKLSLIPQYIPENKICNCVKSHVDTAKEELSRSKTENSWIRRFVKYFELDLLKDLTFLNIIIGLTLSMFAEINFSVLTPFILADFEFTDAQIAFLMSLPSMPDLIFRFLIQFIVKKFKWSNRVYYLLGITGMTIARAIIGLRPSFLVTSIAFFFLGIFKAFRTIFYGIIIPDYVPLKNLPAATGINRLFGGIFPLFSGCIIGIIRDKSNYQVTIFALNILSLITFTTWTLELLFVHKKRKKLLCIWEKV